MLAQCQVKKYKYIMKFIIWIINDIHMEFNDIHWEGCLHITRRMRRRPKREKREILTSRNFPSRPGYARLRPAQGIYQELLNIACNVR